MAKNREKQAKILTNVNSFSDVQKSLQNIETQLNNLFDNVNSISEKDTSESIGESGDINIARNSDGTYSLECCTNEGWKKLLVKTTGRGGTFSVYLGDKSKTNI